MPVYTDEELKKVSNALEEMRKIKKDEDIVDLARVIGSFDPELEKYMLELDRILKNQDEKEAGDFGKKIRKTYNWKNS